MLSACPSGHDFFCSFTQYGLGGTTSCDAALSLGGYDVASSGMDDSSGGIGAMVGGTQHGSQRTASAGLAVAPDFNLVSAVGRDFQHTPSILPVRGHLDSIRQFMKGDLYTVMTKNVAASQKIIRNCFAVTGTQHRRQVELCLRLQQQQRFLFTDLFLNYSSSRFCVCA